MVNNPKPHNKRKSIVLSVRISPDEQLCPDCREQKLIAEFLLELEDIHDRMYDDELECYLASKIKKWQERLR